MIKRKGETIFHYTTVEGALGILSSQDIFATHIRYLNDISELDYFTGVVLEQLSQIAAQLHTAELSLDKALSSKLPQVARAIVRELESLVDVYTVSFSRPASEFEDANGSLSQWRAYGQDGGVALCLDLDRLVASLEQIQRSHPQMRFQHKAVIYGDELEKIVSIQDELRNLSEQLESLLWRISSAMTEDSPDYLDDLISTAMKEDLAIYGEILAKISEQAIYFKHSAFRDEREFRISVERQFFPGLRDSSVKFVVRRGVPTPYVTLFNGSAELPIKRIIVGPHRSSDDRLRAFIRFVLRQGLDIQVEKSTIPFI